MKSQAQEIAETNDRMVRSGFPFYRAAVWEKLGETPLRATVQALIKHFADEPALDLLDVGCGCGDDLLRFKELLRLQDYTGEIRLTGCDLSEEMLAVCRQRGLDGVLRADFLDEDTDLPQAHLLWCHFVLIHVPPDGLDAAIKRCASLTLPNGVAGFAFKTGEDEIRVDPGDERIPVERLSTFHRPETVGATLLRHGINCFARIEIPSGDPSYSYCWLLNQKIS